MAGHLCTAECRRNGGCGLRMAYMTTHPPLAAISGAYTPCEHYNLPPACEACYERDRPKGRHEKPKGS